MARDTRDLLSKVFLIFCLASSGAAHAMSVTVIDVPKNIPTRISSSFGAIFSSEIDTDADTTGVTFYQYGTEPSDLSVTYSIYTDTNPAVGDVTQGPLIGSFVLTGGSVSYFLALAADTQYYLQISPGPGALDVVTSITSTVSPVPLPGAALLFGTALLGAGALRQHLPARGWCRAAARLRRTRGAS